MAVRFTSTYTTNSIRFSLVIWVFLLSVFFCAIVLSNLLRFTDSDYTIGIFKLFLMEVITKIESSWVWQGDLPLPIQPTSSIFLSSSGFAQLQMVQKVLLFQALVTLADFGYHVQALWYYCSQNFKLFDFSIFRFWVYLIKVIPETRRAH